MAGTLSEAMIAKIDAMRNRMVSTTERQATIMRAALEAIASTTPSGPPSELIRIIMHTARGALALADAEQPSEPAPKYKWISMGTSDSDEPVFFIVPMDFTIADVMLGKITEEEFQKLVLCSASSQQWAEKLVAMLNGDRTAIVDAAETFVDQFLFVGLADGECDYAIKMLVQAVHPTDISGNPVP